MADKGPYRKLRYFLFSMIVLVILACIAPFFLKGPNDRALITPDQIQLPDIKFPARQAVDPRFGSGGRKDPADRTRMVIYRWQDKAGTWHFTDYPNPDGPSQEIQVTFDPAKEQKASSSSEMQQDALSSRDETLSDKLRFSIDPEDLKKLKEEAEALKKELEDRYQELNHIAGEKSP